MVRRSRGRHRGRSAERRGRGRHKGRSAVGVEGQGDAGRQCKGKRGVDLKLDMFTEAGQHKNVHEHRPTHFRCFGKGEGTKANHWKCSAKSATVGREDTC